MEHPAALGMASARVLVPVLVLLGVAACREKGEEYGGKTTPAGAEMPAGAPPAAPAGALTDGNIAAILSASNLAEIQPSRAAQERATNPAVKDFANRMVTDHTRLEDSLAAMVRTHNINIAPNSTSSQLQTETQQNMSKLQNLQGAQFDKAYMDVMVTTHQQALDAINGQLLPAAQNPMLKTAIEKKVKPMVEDHLNMAKRIQGTLK